MMLTMMMFMKMMRENFLDNAAVDDAHDDDLVLVCYNIVDSSLAPRKSTCKVLKLRLPKQRMAI